MGLEQLAKQIAGKGRFGDDALLHVSKQELAGLAALAPQGTLSVNPATGLPEAFFFLPFLAGLGAAAAPAAAAAIPAAAAAAPAIGAGAGALGAGIAAGMSAATSAIPTAAAAALPAATQIAASVPAAASTLGGLGTLSASGAALPAVAEMATPLTAGVSSMAPAGTSGIAALEAATSAAPALGTVAAPMTPAGGLTAATTLPQLGDLAAGIGPAAMPGAGPSFPAAVSPIATPAPAAEGIAAVSEAASPLAGQSFYPPSMATASTGPVEEAAIHAGNAAVSPAMTTDPGTGIGGLLGGMDMNQALMGAAMLSQLMPMGGGGDGEDDGGGGGGDEEYEGGDPVFPGDDYEPGTDDEWDYFPNMRSGGIVHYEGGGGVLGSQIRQGRMDRFVQASQKANPEIWQKLGFLPKPTTPVAPAPVPVPAGSNPVQPPADYQPGIDPEWNYFAKSGGLIGYAQGGLAGLPAGMTPDIMRASLDPLAAAGGGAGLASLVPQQGGAAPQPDPLPKEQTGSNFGDKELISEAVAAIQGQHPDPDKVIREFIATFGEQALADLVARVRGAGPLGDGMSDSVPAMIDGKQPAALSQGEFVVPADVVSGLGNGDTAAGANQLFGMMDRVRTMRNGGPVQPPAISPKMVMPV